jgi:O-antigen/teichoic acid export membrane protein
LQTLIEIFTLGYKFVFSQLAHRLNQQADQLILGKFGGMESLGIYGRAKQLVMFPINVIGAVVDKIAFPLFARTKQTAQFEVIFNFFFLRIFCITLVSSVYLSINSKGIVLLFLGYGWHEVVPVFEVLSGFFFVRMISYVTGAANKVSGGMTYQLYASYFMLLMLFIAAWGGYVNFGLLGVTYAYVGISIITFIIYAIILKKTSYCFGNDFFFSFLKTNKEAIFTAITFKLTSLILVDAYILLLVTTLIILLYTLFFCRSVLKEYKLLAI